LIDFSQSDCDVAIRWSRDDGKGLAYHQLLRGVYTPMLHPSLAESIGGLHRPEDLLRLRIIDPGDIWWSQWFREVGVENPGLDRYPRSRLNVQAFEAAAAIANQGVAMLTPELYADEIALGRLYQPFEHLSSEGKNYWLVYPENRRNIRKIKLFRDWILKRIEESRPQQQPQYPISGA
jgi:LysR family glycine cleavage system transcriptional activator